MRRIFLFVVLECCLLLAESVGAYAGENAAAAPAKNGKAAWEARRLTDAEFLSAMVAAYEATAEQAKPLMEKSEYVSMQMMASDRARSMRTFSKRIAKLLEEKEWDVDPSFARESKERLGALVAEHNGDANEMLLLDALIAYHVETAKTALDAMELTRDADVADMARRIVADQIESIATGKNMPEMIDWEQKAAALNGMDPFMPAMNPNP